jgi:hypothetical protein
VAWLFVAKGMQNPHGLSTQLLRVGVLEESDAKQLGQQLQALHGVHEAVVVGDEGVAYLRVEKERFDLQAASTLCRQ